MIYLIQYIINYIYIPNPNGVTYRKKRKLLDNRFIIKEFFNYYNK
jgi:hypothetical protein